MFNSIFQLQKKTNEIARSTKNAWNAKVVNAEGQTQLNKDTKIENHSKCKFNYC